MSEAWQPTTQHPANTLTALQYTACTKPVALQAFLIAFFLNLHPIQARMVEEAYGIAFFIQQLSHSRFWDGKWLKVCIL